jgi:predicted DNA-binding transcriptional regulator AlpA
MIDHEGAAVTAGLRRGRFGRTIGYFEHEIDLWIHNRIRAATGKPALQAPAVPQHPKIIREREVHARTGLSRVHRWRLEQVSKFPGRVYLDEPADAA